ncbi:MAG TPA: hypothetical protein ENI63_00810 [Candidatus Kaiserbacteria bacterium]|nr:hypothetical protein [Candidatus Kaiserbacteria bacterium]
MSYLYQEAEKFIKDMYWSETHDRRSSLKIEDLVNEKLVKDNKEKDPEYFSHREGVIHASSIYGCLRGVIHEMLGAKPSEEYSARQLGIFQAGNLFEDYVVSSLGDRVIEGQREYVYKYKSITLVGRSDYIINDNGIIRIGENKSVHSDSFWYRQREGTLVAWQNQIQLQIYMWLERELFGNEWEGIFSYISKDDCTVESAPVQYNPRIINEIVKPALEIINEAYEKKDPNIAPLPSMSIFNEVKSQWQMNWLAKYCNYHNHCAGAGWILEAKDEVFRKNKEYKATHPSTPKKRIIKETNIRPVE